VVRACIDPLVELILYLFGARFGWSDSPHESFRQTATIAQKVLSLNDTNPEAHALMAGIHIYLRKYERAVKEVERTLVLGLSHAFV
jgi:hypothetical protein